MFELSRGLAARSRRASRPVVIALVAAVIVALLMLGPSPLTATGDDPTPVATTGAEGVGSESPTGGATDSEPADSAPTVESTDAANADPTQEPTGDGSPADDAATPDQPAAESPADDSSKTPAETPSEVPADGRGVTEQPSEQAAGPGDEMVTPLAVGPDGGTAPYVYWTVKDEAGALVSGATFQFEYRSGNDWATGNNASALGDCVTTCVNSSLDRDTDAGEFLLEHRATARNNSNRIGANTRYRVTPNGVPAGYEWVSTDAVEVPSNWGGGNTYDVGTFVLRKLPTAPRCEAGYVYGVTEGGQIRQVDASGAVTALGQSAAGVSSFNGIGIGTGGSPVYAYDRTNNLNTATIWRYDTTTGAWTSTGVSVNSTTNGRTVTFVAGAVSLSSDRYYFGGFNATGTQFRLWEYTPATNAVAYKGYVDTTQGSGGQANGDLAFDSDGNMFVVRGSGSTSTVFSITAANLAAANGGQIISAGANSVTTTSDVNGIAFDAAGRVYLGSGTQLRSYAMPGFSDGQTVVSSNLGTTDLASCGSPPTITIEKYVEGGRVQAGDQFTISLNQGSTQIATATTTGNAAGVQDERIGPIPTVRNVLLTFSESTAGTTNLSQYATSWRCELDDAQVFQGNGTSGSITIPSTGQEVKCRFHNSPLVANVTMHKDVLDVNGENPQPGVGWTVGAATTATTGSATQAPVATTQLTNAAGNAAWQVRFGAYADRATVAVSETQQPGFGFVDGSCVITKLDGTSATTTLTGPSAQSLTGIAPGDTVACTYRNKPTAATVTVTKTWVVNGQTYAHGSQPDALAATLTLSPPGSTPDTSVDWGEERGPFTIGQAVTIGESTSIQQAGCTLDSAILTGNGVAAGGVSVQTAGHAVTLPGAANEYVITNTVSCQQLTLVKAVTNSHGGAATPADWNGNLIATPTGDTAIAFNHNETKPVAAGEYVLSETDVAGYELDALSCVGGTFDEAGQKLTLAKGESATCTFTNKDKPGAVAWQKVDSDDATAFLPGSQWTITGPGHPGTVVDDCVAAAASDCTGADRNPAAGQFELTGLSWGDYTVTETKAPPGYVLSSPANSFTFTVSAANAGTTQTHDDWTFGNVRPDGPALPQTGGIGRDQIVLAGAVTLLLALAGYATRRVRSRGIRA